MNHIKTIKLYKISKKNIYQLYLILRLKEKSKQIKLKQLIKILFSKFMKY